MATPAEQIEADDPNGIDGRVLRRNRNRAAVVDALLDLYGQGNLQPSAVEIAERAGLSPRSLYRYFDDIDDLSREAVNRQLQRAWPLVPIAAAPDAPLGERVDALVTQRFRLFEATAPAATVSRLRAPFQPRLAAQLVRSRAYLRNQLSELFQPELSAMTTVRATTTLIAVDVLCSFETLRMIQDDQTLSTEQARAVLSGSVTTLLAAPEA